MNNEQLAMTNSKQISPRPEPTPLEMFPPAQNDRAMDLAAVMLIAVTLALLAGVFVVTSGAR